MNSHTLKMVKYWRKALIDGASLAGRITVKDFSKEYMLIEYVHAGELTDELHARIAEKVGENTDPFRQAYIAPLVYQKRVEHGQLLDQDEFGYIVPLYLPCTVNKDGRLSADSKEKFRIPRELLSPVDALIPFSLATMETYSDALERFSMDIYKQNKFEEFWNIGAKFFKATSPQCNNILEQFGFKRINQVAIVFVENNALRIKNVKIFYDCIMRDCNNAEVTRTVLDAFCSGPPIVRDVPAVEDSFSDRLGYADNKHFLAPYQRVAAACLLNLKEGEVVAVNGPPGTGKTSMLLSLVATEMSRAALAQAAYPPIIFAASTNNQAVTNILADFAKIPVGENIFRHWLPGLTSFGSYFSSTKKREESVEASGSHASMFFESIRSPKYLQSAEIEFIKHAGQALNKNISELNDVLAVLTLRIRKEHDVLKKCHSMYIALKKKQDLFQLEDKNFLNIEPAVTVAMLEETLQHWEEMLRQRSFGEIFFAWLPSYRKQIQLKQNKILEKYYPKYLGRKLFNLDVKGMPDEARSYLVDIKEYINDVIQFQNFIKEHSRIQENVAVSSIQEADEAFDATVRRRIFWLSVHYWEGRWLKEAIENPRPDDWKSTPYERAREWRMRMMLTPCAVATFHRLSSLLRIEDNKVFAPLYGLIDLLIVEEAGQVSPELAGASFALAKRAVVVGDTSQIEPIWSVPSMLDTADAKMEELDPKELGKDGQLASSGSVMRMAQAASTFSMDLRGLSRGLYLVEHRRCLDEIIAYCNKLCYGGYLTPRRGDQAHLDEHGQPHLDIPPMCGIPIFGAAESQGESRWNTREARAVAAWIALHRDELCTKYNAKLPEILGVVTPFVKQADLIKEKLKALGITEEITFGTVHRLQGAERAVVLFSPVYTHEDANKKLFLNQSPNMLNVAASRAKDHFIVIGDTRLIGAVDANSPYGMLFSYLKRSNEMPAFPKGDEDEILAQAIDKYVSSGTPRF